MNIRLCFSKGDREDMDIIEKGRLPTRLFDVLNKKIIISESLKEDVKYLIISYVWNSNISMPFRYYGSVWNIYSCSSKGLERMIDDVKILRFIYVWIDCLCINQDSISDKEIEVSIIGNYFKNCETCLVYLNGLDNSLSLDNQSLYIPFSPDNITLPVPEWFERVWTLQEAILPSKILFSTRDGIVGVENIFEWLKLKRDSNKLDSPIIQTSPGVFVIRGTESKELPLVLTSLDTISMRGKSWFSAPEIFEIIASRKCQLDVDRVYSILGLLNIRVDVSYSDTIEHALYKLSRCLSPRDVTGLVILTAKSYSSDKLCWLPVITEGLWTGLSSINTIEGTVSDLGLAFTNVDIAAVSFVNDGSIINVHGKWGAWGVSSMELLSNSDDPLSVLLSSIPHQPGFSYKNKIEGVGKEIIMHVYMGEKAYQANTYLVRVGSIPLKKPISLIKSICVSIVCKVDRPLCFLKVGILVSLTKFGYETVERVTIGRIDSSTLEMLKGLSERATKKWNDLFRRSFSNRP